MFSLLICQSLYDVKPKAQSEQCAHLAIKCLMANHCMRWRRIFKGFTRDGGQADFSKNPPRLSL